MSATMDFTLSIRSAVSVFRLLPVGIKHVSRLVTSPATHESADDVFSVSSFKQTSSKMASSTSGSIPGEDDVRERERAGRFAAVVRSPF